MSDEPTIRLMLGDCLDRMAEIEDASVDAIVTDPPFKLSQEYGANVDSDNLLAVSGFWPAAAEMFRVAKPGSLAAVFYDTRILPLALEAMRRGGWRYLRGLTFYRRWGSASVLHGWMSTSDFILLFAKPGDKCSFYGETRHDVYVKTGPESVNARHPAQKPLDAVAHIVGRVTRPGGLVLDPYMGSGTTIVAAADAHRNAIGIEKDASYYAIAERRLADHRATVLLPGQLDLFSPDGAGVAS